MGDRRWEIGDGRSEMGDRRWEIGDGRWKMRDASVEHGFLLPSKGRRIKDEG